MGVGRALKLVQVIFPQLVHAGSFLRYVLSCETDLRTFSPREW